MLPFKYFRDVHNFSLIMKLKSNKKLQRGGREEKPKSRFEASKSSDAEDKQKNKNKKKKRVFLMR